MSEREQFLATNFKEMLQEHMHERGQLLATNTCLKEDNSWRRTHV